MPQPPPPSTDTTTHHHHRHPAQPPPPATTTTAATTPPPATTTTHRHNHRHHATTPPPTSTITTTTHHHQPQPLPPPYHHPPPPRHHTTTHRHHHCHRHHLFGSGGMNAEIGNSLNGTPKGTAQINVKNEGNSEETTTKDLEDYTSRIAVPKIAEASCSSPGSSRGLEAKWPNCKHLMMKIKLLEAKLENLARGLDICKLDELLADFDGLLLT
uniref:Uncharacterized protein n=1 Tax=Tanacetum cinerariifolium TaxID=118510 RepID=A0A6L2LSV2_TANCI|nr:hypothetical protein [Tanacetum cinerariifolium]